MEYASETAFAFDAGGFGSIAGMVKVLLDEGHTSISLVAPDVPAAAGLEPLLGPAVEAEGGELVNYVPIPAGAADYSQFVAAAEANGATATAAALTDGDVTQFFDAAAQLDTDLILSGSPQSFSIGSLESLDDLAEQAVYASGIPAATSVEDFPELEQFLEDMEASGAEELSAAQVTSTGLRAWLAVHALVTVMEGTETIDDDAVVEAFAAAEDVDMLGLVPAWTPSTRQEGVFANISNPMMLRMRFDGERWVTETDDLFDVVEFMSGA